MGLFVGKMSSNCHFALYDVKKFRSRCKLQGCPFFSHLFCEECGVHLCITSKRNCFYDYHHNSQSKENNAPRQNKPIRRTIETATNANEVRSGRRRTPCVVNEPKKEYHQIMQMKVVNHGKKKRTGRVLKRTATITSVSASAKKKQMTQSEHNTRSKMCAEKTSFMTMIGLKFGVRKEKD